MTPLASAWLQPERVPLAGLVPIVRVTLEESVVTVLPPASWTVTFGWVVKAVPPVAPAGCWLTASLVAVPTVTLNADESPAVSAPAAAFVIPAIVNVPLVPAASAQVPPLFASVTTTVALPPGLVRPQLLKPAVGVTVGEAGTVVPAGRATVIVSPAASAPVVGGGP